METKTTSSTTFKLSDVEPQRFSNPNKASSKPTISAQLQPYAKFHCTEVLMETQFGDAANVLASLNNGFVNTVINCYNHHSNLVIRPDDLDSDNGAIFILH